MRRRGIRHFITEIAQPAAPAIRIGFVRRGSNVAKRLEKSRSDLDAMHCMHDIVSVSTPTTNSDGNYALRRLGRRHRRIGRAVTARLIISRGLPSRVLDSRGIGVI